MQSHFKTHYERKKQTMVWQSIHECRQVVFNGDGTADVWKQHSYIFSAWIDGDHIQDW